MLGIRLPETDDPVVVYDLMREAANRLVAEYAAQRTDAGLPAAARDEIRRIRQQVASVDPEDMDAQRRLTDELWARVRAFV